jgi:glycosyltransferase involved in cell wall biosynthesis
MLTISIAICTYNGETYLREQLDSYVAQTRLPDEVVVCDDCSKDSTREILTAFASNAPFPVKLYFNERNLNYIKNFEKAIGLCTGDIIVLSDQDDVWRKDKIQLIEDEFTKSEKIGMVYADAEIVDENLRSLNSTMWQGINFNLEKQKNFNVGKAFDSLLKDGCVYGSSMAFRAKFRCLIVPIPLDIYFGHDNWIALMISAVADILLINDTLIKYRQHQHQSSIGVRLDTEAGFKKMLKSGQRVNKYDGLINQLNILEKRLGENSDLTNEVVSKIDAIRKHIWMRAGLPKDFSTRLLKIGRELFGGRYHLYSNGFRSAVKDLIVSKN